MRQLKLKQEFRGLHRLNLALLAEDATSTKRRSLVGGWCRLNLALLAEDATLNTRKQTTTRFRLNLALLAEDATDV